MTDYFRDVYKKRGNWWGNTPKEQYLNISKQYFSDFLSSFAEDVYIDGFKTKVAVQDNKDDENKTTKFFLVSSDILISVGNIVEWNDNNWIIIQEELNTFEAYQKCLGIRSNYNLKWIDSFGILNETPAFVFGAMDSRIQESFRTANNLYIRQPSNSLEVVIPRHTVKNGQRFIINSRGWKLTGVDIISVEQISYMSLIEDKIDLHNDNLDLQIADYNKLSSSYIDLGIQTLNLQEGENFTFSPLLYFDGKLIENSKFVAYFSAANEIATIDGLTVTGISSGSITIKIAYANQPSLIAECLLTIVPDIVDTSILQIMGDDNIKWGRTRTYTVFHHTGGIPQEIASTFILLNNEEGLVTMNELTNTSFSITANSKGQSGTVIIQAVTAVGTIEKEINIVSVW